MIDGMDNNERYIGTIGVKPSIDAIAEVKVQTNLYSAEVGRTAGGVINILTKSGSNHSMARRTSSTGTIVSTRATSSRQSKPEAEPESVRRQRRRADHHE